MTPQELKEVEVFRKEHKVVKCPEMDKHVRITLTYEPVPVTGGGVAEELVRASCPLLNNLLAEGKNCGRSCRIREE
jgi:hypothetical protein